MEKAGMSRPSMKRLNQCQYIRGQKSGEFLKSISSKRSKRRCEYIKQIITAVPEL